MKKSNIKALSIIIGVLLAYFLPIRYINFLGNERIIDFVQKKYFSDKKNYLDLVVCINNQEINSKYFLIKYFSRRSKVNFKNLINKNYFAVNEKSYPKIYSIVKQIECQVFVKKDEYFAFEYRKSNFTGSSDIKLVYDLNNSRPLKEKFPGFEILEKEQRPSSFSKWIYIIDDNWYILIE